MVKKSLVVAAAVTVALLAGCTTAEVAQYNSYGKKHHIRLFSGGKCVGEWESSGKVLNNSSSDGYFFMDDKSGMLIDISGEVIIETEK